MSIHDMYIKIYFDDKPLFLCDSIDNFIQPYIHHDDAVFIDELDSHTVKSMIHEMQEPSVHAGVFFHPDLEKLKKTFFKKFTLILAAGGLVTNENNEILLIFRRGKWDLPKGKLEKGEKLEDCAHPGSGRGNRPSQCKTAKATNHHLSYLSRRHSFYS